MFKLTSSEHPTPIIDLTVSESVNSKKGDEASTSGLQALALYSHDLVCLSNNSTTSIGSSTAKVIQFPSEIEDQGSEILENIGKIRQRFEENNDFSSSISKVEPPGKRHKAHSDFTISENLKEKMLTQLGSVDSSDEKTRIVMGFDSVKALLVDGISGKDVSEKNVGLLAAFNIGLAELIQFQVREIQKQKDEIQKLESDKAFLTDSNQTLLNQITEIEERSTKTNLKCYRPDHGILKWKAEREALERKCNDLDDVLEEMEDELQEKEQRLEETEQRLKETEQRLEETGQRLEETGQRLEETERKLKRSEQANIELKTRLSALNAKSFLG